MVHRAVSNGWDTPQHIRDAICDQLVPAMNAYVDQMRNGPTPSARGRAGSHVVKVAMLALKMEATERIAAGQPKTWFPYLRKRYPEMRWSRRGENERLAKALRRLVDKLDRQRQMSAG